MHDRGISTVAHMMAMHARASFTVRKELRESYQEKNNWPDLPHLGRCAPVLQYVEIYEEDTKQEMNKKKCLLPRQENLSQKTNNTDKQQPTWTATQRWLQKQNKMTSTMGTIEAWTRTHQYQTMKRVRVEQQYYGKLLSLCQYITLGDDYSMCPLLVLHSLV